MVSEILRYLLNKGGGAWPRESSAGVTRVSEILGL